MRHLQRLHKKSEMAAASSIASRVSAPPQQLPIPALVDPASHTGLPGHASAATLRQAAMMRLQRNCGNRTVLCCMETGGAGASRENQQEMGICPVCGRRGRGTCECGRPFLPRQAMDPARSEARPPIQRSCPSCEDELQRQEAAEEAGVAPAIQYNASRQFTGSAIAVIQAEVGAPSSGMFDEATVHAVARWQGDNARLRKLDPDGKLGPQSLGTLIAELAARDEVAAARTLAAYPHKLPAGAVGIPSQVEGSSESSDSCAGKSKHGPGTFSVIRDFPTVKAYEIGNFDIAKHFLKPEHRTGIEEQFMDDDIIRLVKEEGWSVQILGGASTTGSDAYNKALSELRAICTHLFLLDLGMPAGTMKHGGGGEHAARERLKTEGALVTDEVEAPVDRRVQIWVIKGKAPEPEEPEDPCPQEEVLCHMWWQLADPCSLLIISEIFATDIACSGFNPLICLVLEAGGVVSDDMKELAGACCSIEHKGKTGEGVAELLENCMIGFMLPKIPEHFGECDELEDEAVLRESLRACMKQGDPR